MNRANFFRTLAAFLAAPLSFARRKPDVWSTPQGQYVLMLRAELERLGHFDDLKEDWQEVEDALNKGHQFFAPMPSRWDVGTQKLTQSILPVYPVYEYPGHLDWRTADFIARHIARTKRKHPKETE